MVAGACTEENPNDRQGLKRQRTTQVRTATARAARIRNELWSDSGPRVPRSNDAPAPCSVSHVQSCYIRVIYELSWSIRGRCRL